MSQAMILAAAAEKELPMTPIMFGVVALISFVALLGLTWTFRGFANKHR